MGGSKMKMGKILVLLLIILELGFWSEAEGCLEHERSALIKLKDFFNHPFILQEWVKRDCCQWVGVMCNATTGSVLAIDLHFSRNIWKSGEYWYLNASLFTPFQQLKSLDLSYNNIAGCVENEGLERLSRLSNLKLLNLGFNAFNNSIFSSLSHLLSLTNLDVSFNRLKGIIGIRELDSLSNLEKLDMSGNEISKFVAPKGLNKLKFLSLSGNKINHSILSSLSVLSSLRSLHLSENGLKGSFEFRDFDFFSNLEVLDISKNEIENLVIPKGLSKLVYLDLSGNKLNHSLLSSLTGHSSLTFLNLRENEFKGTFVVQELDTLSNLETLDMSYNEIDNLIVPKDYKGLRKLNSLYLDGVAITDGRKLLQSMGSFPSLNTLHLGFNNFTGTVTTQELHKFTNLEELTLDQSSYHISLLRSIAAFTSLGSLSMSDCKVNGVLSDHQGMCDELVHLKELDISGSDLRGPLPWCLANMTSLRVLDVSSNQFTGNIFSSPLIHLTSIEELTLSNNQFQIPISLEPFFNHSKLKIFKGGSNEIYAETESSHSSTPKFQLNTIELSGFGNGGSFPKFLYHQHELQKVDLSHINLRGEFPNWLLKNNTMLDRLILLNNSLSGSLHMTIHSHMSLSHLDISKNNFQGNIPAEIGAYLPSLNSLNLSMNAFKNSIPSSFGDMNLLFSLDLSNNQLTGEIPEYLTMGCYNLKYLVLSNNSLQGHLFSKNFNLTNLNRLQLDGNHFIGKIPESLSNNIFLAGLYLSDNNISGKIPSWLGNLSLLEDITMANNHLEGPIPKEFCQLNLLKILDLSKNNISGSFPSCLSLSSIQQVHMSKNMLQGPLKDNTFRNSSSLVTLDLSYNRLNGSIADWIYKLTKLSYLILGNNNLEGEVPVQLCQLKRLRLIDLSYNSLSGQIPHCLDNTSLHEDYYDALTPTSAPTPAPTPAPTSSPPFDPSLAVPYIGSSMGKEETISFTTKEIHYFYKGKPLYGMYGIDFSCNKLTGEIPSQIGELTRIRTLNLSHNNLTEAIPATFSNLRQVESMDLSYNNLNGTIPPQLVKLNALAVFSVAHNNLSGKIPEWTAQFATFNENSYEGNPLLCGPPLPKSCNENGSSQAIIPEASTSNGKADSLIDMDGFYITFTVSYVIVILGIVGVLWVNPYWRRKWFYLCETWMTSCYYFIVDNLVPTRFYRT